MTDRIKATLANIAANPDSIEAQILAHHGITPEALVAVPGKEIHQMVGGWMLTDGAFAVFIDQTNSEQFLYYMGLERSKLVARIESLSVYEPDRELEKYTDRTPLLSLENSPAETINV
jgi:hypothetical protein